MLKPVSVLLALCAALSALLLTGCGGGEEDAPTPTCAPADTKFFTEEEPDPASAFREAELYFLSDEGYVVPVKKLIPREEGIARACLGCITSSPVNDAAAAEAGLNTVLPSGCEYTLSIQNGEARLDFTRLAPFASAEKERAAMDAVVNTLCAFSTVDTVTVTKNGAGGELENGTELPKCSPKRYLNPEKPELETSAGARPGTLYFANTSGALTVPVTRYFGSEPSLYTLVSALISGPETKGLMCCFPEGTLLLGAALENGVATVNLSADFTAVEDIEGMYSLAKSTLLMTIAERFPARGVIIQVNGALYDPENC